MTSRHDRVSPYKHQFYWSYLLQVQSYFWNEAFSANAPVKIQFERFSSLQLWRLPFILRDSCSLEEKRKLYWWVELEMHVKSDWKKKLCIREIWKLYIKEMWLFLSLPVTLKSTRGGDGLGILPPQYTTQSFPILPQLPLISQSDWLICSCR